MHLFWNANKYTKDKGIIIMKKLPLKPHHIFISDQQIQDVQPVFKNKTLAGITKIKSQQYQYYKGDVDISTMNEQATSELTAFMASLRGGVVPFYLQLPNMKQKQYITGSASVPIANAKGADRIVINGFRGTLIGGEYFNIANDTKLYQVLSAGKAGSVFEISPQLRMTNTAGAALSFDAHMKVRLDDDSYTTKPNKSIKYLTVVLKFEEDISNG
jgi:hypothetical protein